MRYKYKKIPSANCPFKGIQRVYGDVRACTKKCDKINRCFAFMFHFNKPARNYCWLKYKCEMFPSYVGDNMYLALKQRDNTYQEQAITTQAVAEHKKTARNIQQ